MVKPRESSLKVRAQPLSALAGIREGIIINYSIVIIAPGGSSESILGISSVAHRTLIPCPKVPRIHAKNSSTGKKQYSMRWFSIGRRLWIMICLKPNYNENAPNLIFGIIT